MQNHIKLENLIQQHQKAIELRLNPIKIFAFELFDISKKSKIKLVKHNSKQDAVKFVNDFLNENDYSYKNFKFIKKIDLLNISNRDLQLIDLSNEK